MRFLFVDRIHAVNSDIISGSRFFGEKDPWRYTAANGQSYVATGVISEAVGQLVSWLTLKENNFSARPVFLFVNKIELDGLVKAGSTVELSAQITDRKAESFLFSGSATVNGKVVVRLQDCGGFFMPLSELEDPKVTEARFYVLAGDGATDCHEPSPGFNFNSLVDKVEERTEGSAVLASKTFLTTDPFYRDHFPRFPVTPIVVINEMIGRVTTSLWNEPKELIPVSVSDLKIRSFIKPGDQVKTSVKIVETFNDQIETVAEIIVEGKRILRGRYRYQIKGEK